MIWCTDCLGFAQGPVAEKMKREVARLASEAERLEKEVARQKSLRWGSHCPLQYWHVVSISGCFKLAKAPAESQCLASLTAH